MNRLETLKEQFPEFNISIIDLFNLIDTTNRYKYVQLFCQLFKTDITERFDKSFIKRTNSRLKEAGIDSEGLPVNQSIMLSVLVDFLLPDNINVLTKFVNHMENNRIDVKDVTAYKSFDEINMAISKAEFKEIKKSLQNQVVKEFENDDWLVIRPLTMESSKKYGASTKWCTTSDKDDFYFYKHMIKGVLTYFINKQSGYKFAGFKDLETKELSFWNAADIREDSLSLNIDSYMYDEIKKIFSSTKPNIEFCDKEQYKVAYQIYEQMYDDEGIRRIPDIEEEFNGPRNIDDEDGYAVIDGRRIQMGGVHQVDIDDEDTPVIPIHNINYDRNVTDSSLDYGEINDRENLARILNQWKSTNTFSREIND